MAGTVLLEASGFTDITLTNSGSDYQLGRYLGPQGQQYDVAWARSRFTHPVPTGSQALETGFFIPVRVLGTTDANFQSRKDALLALTAEPVWTLTWTRGSWSEVYLCSSGSWSYDSGGAGFKDVDLPRFKQELAITVPCVRTS